MFLKLLGLGALGYAGYKYYDKNRAGSRPAFAGEQGDVGVRDAGPQAMRDSEPRKWTKADQASDESFPASDPPATY